MTTITIYHNPACGTSRNVLALIRNSGVEPTIIEYLKNPPTTQQIQSWLSAMGVSQGLVPEPVWSALRSLTGIRVGKGDVIGEYPTRPWGRGCMPASTASWNPWPTAK